MADSEASILDSPSSTTSFLSSEEHRHSSGLPSPNSGDRGPSSFSQPSTALRPLPSAPQAGSCIAGHPGIYSPVAISPEPTTHLIDWLPDLTSAPPVGIQGDGQERQGPEKGGGKMLHAVGKEGNSPRLGMEELLHRELVCPSPIPSGGSLGANQIPSAGPSLETDVGSILMELKTMNGHLAIIATALTKLASSLAPRAPSSPEAPGSK
ncbi:uncharacterized protein LOC119932121 [Tachyglossus aculeatus]|uniref:uncharacterized protein LOC119932121 n=1 Tax=Tachyglossus aculeatus TaxID=9261 RepID=UPI0018F3716A|nr:uncharacterized protein LOC119932121 [Tachyglossus aculeatus]